MSKERASTQATPTMSVGTPRIRSPGGKTGPARQASREAWAHDRIARLVYELYEKRGRQEGRALEGWLNLTFPVARYGVGLSFREVFGIEFCDTPQLAAGSFIAERNLVSAPDQS
ncbi:MAG TPA: DUF2934 domain-containing protein [Nitrospira sp.]|nr:DUF2934 domain-containing protein [Nitrospira sp.]